MDTSSSAAGQMARQERLLTTLERLLAIQATAVRPALNEASQLVNQTLNADKSEVFLYESTSDTLVSAGISDTPMARKQVALGLDRLALSNGGKTVAVFQSGENFRSGQLDKEPDELPGITKALGVRSVVVVPVDVDGTRRGCLQVDSAQEGLFTLEDELFLAAAARWIGMVLHRAELVERIAQEAAEHARETAADDLITILAHDLRTPLVALKGRAAMVQMRSRRDGHAANLNDANAVLAAATRLERMISDLMDSARLEKGIFSLMQTVVNLAELARETAAMVQTQEGEIEVRGPDEVVVEGDANRLRQVLENLLGNARRYSPAGVPVIVDVSTETRDDGAWAIVAVSDAGPGIPADVLPRLFTRFTQGPGSKGLGLGLYLARGIAEAHGGTLVADSRPGQGTTFRLALPQLTT